MPFCQCYFLGIPHIVVDGRSVTLRQKKAIAILAYLSLEGKDKSREHLAAFFWPNAAPERAHRSLRTVIWELNRSPVAPWLHIDRSTLAVRMDNTFWADAIAIRNALTDRNAHGHNLANICPACVPLFREVLALWSGDFLSDFAINDSIEFEQWQTLHNQNMHQAMTDAYQGLLNWSVYQNEQDQARNLSREWILSDPINEEPYRVLMHLYDQMGQRSMALQTYENYLHALTSDSDLNPSDEMIHLLHQIRGGCSQTHSPPCTHAHAHSFPLPALMPKVIPQKNTLPPNNLPSPPTTLIGRDNDMENVIAMLQNPDVRLLTLTGTGGTGKTRLAIQVAKKVLPAFPDGAFFIALSPVHDPVYVTRAIAVALGISGPQNMGFAYNESKNIAPYWLNVLTSYLKHRSILLILDNYEHVLASATDLSPILSAAPNLKILVTSRIPLQIYGEYLYEVMPLALPEKGIQYTPRQLMGFAAVEMFVMRTKAVRYNLRITDENAETINEICRKLDGLPLALELAAVRARHHTLAEILSHLDITLAYLTKSPAGVQSRHQSIRACLDWSYQMLKPVEKIMFQRLSVFNGSFDPITAYEVTGNIHPFKPEDILEALAQQNMVRITYELGQTRGSMLGIVRDYALEHLQKSGNEQATRAQHAEAYLGLCKQVEDTLYAFNSVQALWMDRLAAELDNIRDALSWAMAGAPALALELAAVLSRFWCLRGEQSEGFRWLHMALESYRKATPITDHNIALHAWALFELGFLSTYVDVPHAAQIFESSLALYQRLKDPAGIGMCLTELGIQTWYLKNSEKADAFLQQAVPLLEQSGKHRRLGRAYQSCFDIKKSLGDPETAEKYIELLESLSTETNDLWFSALAKRERALIAMDRGHYEQALHLFTQVSDLARTARDTDFEVSCLQFMGLTAHKLHNYPQAKEYYAAAIAYQHRVGNKIPIGWAYTHLADLHCEEGQPAQALIYYQQALHTAQQCGDPWLQAWLPFWIAHAEIDMGDLEAATQHLLQCIKNEGAVASHILVGVSCSALSKVRYRQGLYNQAAQVGAFADALISAQSDLSALDESFYAGVLEPSRAWLQEMTAALPYLLGEDAYASAFSLAYQNTLNDRDIILKQIINAQTLIN